MLPDCFSHVVAKNGRDVVWDGQNFVKITTADFAEVLFGVLHTFYLLASRFRHVTRLFFACCGPEWKRRCLGRTEFGQNHRRFHRSVVRCFAHILFVSSASSTCYQIVFRMLWHRMEETLFETDRILSKSPHHRDERSFRIHVSVSISNFRAYSNPPSPLDS